MHDVFARYPAEEPFTSLAVNASAVHAFLSNQPFAPGKSGLPRLGFMGRLDLGLTSRGRAMEMPEVSARPSATAARRGGQVLVALGGAVLVRGTVL